MEATRADLANKLETLEQQVMDTVSGTTAAVSETVESVKEAVQETVNAVKGTVHESVASVRNAFDVSLQIDRHPWFFVAGSVALGFFSGVLMEKPRRGTRSSSFGQHRYSSFPTSGVASGPSTGRMSEGVSGDGTRSSFAGTTEGWSAPGLLGSLASEFSTELNKLKSLAVGAGLGLVRDAVAQAVPEGLKPRVSEVMDSLTTKLGGDVVNGPLWRDDESSQATGERFQGSHGSTCRSA